MAWPPVIDTFFILIFKLSVIASGTTIVYFGYKLFCKGIYDNDCDVELWVKDWRLILRRATPGIVFVVFGAVLIACTAGKGMTIIDRNYRYFPETPLVESPPAGGSPVMKRYGSGDMAEYWDRQNIGDLPPSVNADSAQPSLTPSVDEIQAPYLGDTLPQMP